MHATTYRGRYANKRSAAQCRSDIPNWKSQSLLRDVPRHVACARSQRKCRQQAIQNIVKPCISNAENILRMSIDPDSGFEFSHRCPLPARNTLVRMCTRRQPRVEQPSRTFRSLREWPVRVQQQRPETRLGRLRDKSFEQSSPVGGSERETRTTSLLSQNGDAGTCRALAPPLLENGTSKFSVFHLDHHLQLPLCSENMRLRPPDRGLAGNVFCWSSSGVVGRKAEAVVALRYAAAYIEPLFHLHLHTTSKPPNCCTVFMLVCNNFHPSECSLSYANSMYTCMLQSTSSSFPYIPELMVP